MKAFSRNKSGEISFYKDGYTDLRGRFDYASLNSDNLSSVDKFSIFIMSDDLGYLFYNFDNIVNSLKKDL